MNKKDITNLSPSDQILFSKAITDAGGDQIARADIAKIKKTTSQLVGWAAGGSSADGTQQIDRPGGGVVVALSPAKIMDYITLMQAADPGDLTLIFDNKLV